MRIWAIRVGAVMAGVLLASCSPTDNQRTVAASFYPLAYLAERVADPTWRVIDLTPPGAEPHDVELTLKTRAQLERADLVLYLGALGFQPQVEEAVKEADGTVVALGEEIVHLVALDDGTIDPHVWLDPRAMRAMAEIIARRLTEIDPNGDHPRGAELLRADLEELSQRYKQALDPDRCRFRTAIVSHEAFNYALAPYRFRQFGLAGLEPEAEPTLERIATAESLLDRREAGAVFFDPVGEGRGIVETIAGDFGVPALPLSTLESEPPSGDYLSAMQDNLESLREGLGCE